jgi:uncharacterized protein YegJ (DUF2314 family)
MLHRHLPVFIILGAVSVGVQSQSVVERAARDETINMAREEPAMRRAFDLARAKLDNFLKLAAAPAAKTSDYALKVAVSDGRNTEYFWVNAFKSEGAGFSGVLGNEPRRVKTYKFGERFNFHREQIVDWTYLDVSGPKPRMIGNYTACALLSKEPARQANEFMEKYGLSCE